LVPALGSLADRPIAFFGHSLGGLLAFEVARAWGSAGGRQPEHLFVSSAPAPQLPRDRSLISALPDTEFLAALRALGGTPPNILAHSELMELALPALRADFTLDERYRYRTGAPLTVPITALGGEADKSVPPAALAAWRHQTTAACTVQTFPGDHFYLEAQVEAVVALVVRQLVTARAAPITPPKA
jgi:surfactin synthase thioesterase subunit